ncbi:MAG: choice-of-anchor tandem repeat GloVer-containing protein [Candidatus Sulfotelmatobacter sp.]
MKARFLSYVCGAATLVLLGLTISPSARAATVKETRVHEFNEAVDPEGLVADSAGNLYGTTGSDGFYGFGTVFQVRPSPYGVWTESTLYSFTGGSDGGAPEAVLTLDAQGNLYGTTQVGGSGSCNCGTVFELSPSAHGVWTETTLYSFAGGADGSNPRYTNLVFDAAGNLYGVTEFGGIAHDGTVFEVSPQEGGGWTESVLYAFAGGATDGANPLGGLVFDTAGNLYGAASDGGLNFGGVFELSPQAGGGWKEQMIYFFKSGSDGAGPDSLLIIDPAGNLYGMTQGGGGSESCGIVFKLSPESGGAWSKKTLHEFTGDPDGCAPFLNMVRDSAGNLYGVTEGGGSMDDGAIFQITPGGKEQTFFSFSGGNEGSDPRSLIIGPSGRALFGMTFGLGSNSSGILFELSK